MSHLLQLNTKGKVPQSQDDFLVSGFIRKDIESADIADIMLRYYTLWEDFRFGDDIKQLIQEIPCGQCITIKKKEQILPTGECLAICVDVYHRSAQGCNPFLFKAVIRLLAPFSCTMDCCSAVLRDRRVPQSMFHAVYTGTSFGISCGPGYTKKDIPVSMHVFLNINKYEIAAVESKWKLKRFIYLNGYMKWSKPNIRDAKTHDGIVFTIRDMDHCDGIIFEIEAMQQRRLDKKYHIEFELTMRMSNGNIHKSDTFRHSVIMKSPTKFDSIDSIEVLYQRSRLI